MSQPKFSYSYSTAALALIGVSVMLGYLKIMQGNDMSWLVVLFPAAVAVTVGLILHVTRNW